MNPSTPSWIPATVYILCTLTSLACAVLLGRGYGRTHVRLLLWSAICFAGLAINNLWLFLDKVVWPEKDAVLGIEFQLWRALFAIAGIGILLFGLVWDSE